MHPLRQLCLWCALTLLVAGGAGPAWASLTVYDTLPDWQAATDTFSTLDFEEITGTLSYSTSTGYVNDLQIVGQHFGGTPYFLWAVDTDAVPSHDFGSGEVLKGPAYSNNIERYTEIILSGGVTAFAIDLMAVNDSGGTAESFSIDFSTGESVSSITSLAQPNRKFVGVTSTDTLNWARVIIGSGNPESTYPLIDNIRYGTAAAPGGADLSSAPEPGTYLLVGMGLIGLALVRRKVSGH